MSDITKLCNGGKRARTMAYTKEEFVFGEALDGHDEKGRERQRLLLLLILQELSKLLEIKTNDYNEIGISDEDLQTPSKRIQ